MGYRISSRIRRIYGPEKGPQMLYLCYESGRSVMLSEYFDRMPLSMVHGHRTPFDTLDVSTADSLESSLKVIDESYESAGLPSPALVLCVHDFGCSPKYVKINRRN